MTTRRTVLRGALASALLPTAIGHAASNVTVLRVRDSGPKTPIAPFIYGSNELGRMDGGKPSIDFDRPVGTPFRRLGGNLMTGYNWTRNTDNAGKDWHHVNGNTLADALELSPEVRKEPGAVIIAMHRNSLDIGAASLVTLPLAGFVAADANGPVEIAEQAPSKRFVPVVWESEKTAADPIDFTKADIPQLLRRLIAKFGDAASATGIRAYALDNEPGLWTQTHPRIVPEKTTIKALIERSLVAARAIKTIDPHALVFGPASWGVTEFQSFQNAPDWADYSHYGSFLAAYLDAFRKESERVGYRLLDALDIHWYPQSRQGELFRTEDPKLAAALLQAPRSLSEPRYSEDSWVPEALPIAESGGLALPILPSVNRVIEQWYPGTQLAITEFNFGGPNMLASGLAVADGLGRFGRTGVAYANHWSNLQGSIGEAYRLYRDFDGKGGQFPDQGISIENPLPKDLAAYGAVEDAALHVIAINRAANELAIRLGADRAYRQISSFGFEAGMATTGPIGEAAAFDPKQALRLPAFSARHFVLT
jgi:mannan endo-1,4-beta-mannosidase